MQAHVQSLYRSIIDDLIGRVKPDFQEAGVDEAVLDELRVLWEAKLSESGALNSEAYQQFEEAQKVERASRSVGPRAQVVEREWPPLTPTPHNAPARATQAQPSLPPRLQQYATFMQQQPLPPPPSFLTPSWPQHARPAQPQPSTAQQQLTSAHLYARAPAQQTQPAAASAVQRPAVHQPASFVQHATVQELLKRKREQDDQGSQATMKAAHIAGNGHAWPKLPQQDGTQDDDSDLDEEGAPKLLDDLDKAETKQEEDTLSDVDLDDEQPDNPDTWTSHKIVCQFDKVKRTKNKWSCTLRDGIMNIHGQDIVFSTATADLQF